jgi:DNA (cytosine-5)-methyltransferase 1
MRHGSLFSGIGGFDLAAEWMGWENIFHCEINEFGRKVLHYHFPNSISYEDITKTDFTIHRGHIDVLSGGFPCQPYSSAGKRLGKEDERHLWPQMLRALKEISPSWIVGENVYGLINWNGGMVFHEIQADLEAQGYEVFPILCPAVSVNAPHVRQRIFFIANSELNTKRRVCINGDSSNTNCEMLESRDGQRETGRRANEKVRTKSFNKPGDWSAFPSVSPICTRDDGFSNRLDGITFPRWRNESIRAAGNAVVPQLVLQFFKTIAEYERITNSEKNNESSD